MECLRRPAVVVASARFGCRGLQGDAGWAGRRTLWAASPLFVGGRPCDCPGVLRARIRSCRVARLVSVGNEIAREVVLLDALLRVGRASRLLRGGDRGGWRGAVGGAGADRA